MKKIVLMFVAVIALFSSAVGEAKAQDKPIQLALFAPIQIFPDTTTIKGVRFSLLYGRNATVKGLDIGLVSHATSGLSKGAQFGIVGIVDEDFIGFQNNWVNITKGNFEGFQWGLVNLANNANGFQLAFVNHANHASGFQLGLVNYARTLDGLQIGLINIIKTGGQFPVFPIVNWSF